MFSKTTTAILQEALGDELPEIIIARGAMNRLASMIAERGFKTPLIMTDRQIVEARHQCAGLAYPHYIFETPTKADVQLVETALNAATHADVLIAFGSGTINDIVKRAAYLSGKPYICTPTAPSMNGYGSRNASLINGHKKSSLQGALPIAILADLEIVAQAPLRMIQAGLGDSMARPTAQADWLLSHQVKGTAYDARVYELTKEAEAYVFDRAEQLLERDATTIAKLMELLILSGLGMTIAGSSAPASGGEHAIAHVIEELHGNPNETLHGEQIAYTSQVMAGMIASPPPLDLTSLAKRAKLPTTPEELGWKKEWVDEAIRLAPTMRERYGYLNQSN
jgi:glycerol dehydrogenase-like iron-containing ADH family enzyme